MGEPLGVERRLSSLEGRVEEVAADAAAARHLAAARDRDLADVGVKVDANRKAINALGAQTAARFDRLEQRFDRLEGEVRTGFAEMRGKFDQTAAGHQRIVQLLDTHHRPERHLTPDRRRVGRSAQPARSSTADSPPGSVNHAIVDP